MNIQSIKDKINNLPLITEVPSEEDLEKYIGLSKLILEIFYTFEDDFLFTESYQSAVAIETCYIIENTPWEDVYKQYNYLSQFNVAGAISGTVKEKYLPYVSPIVKALLEKFGYFTDISRNRNLLFLCKNLI